MAKRNVVVFCQSQAEINEAVQHWVNENGYKRAHTFTADKKSGHFYPEDDGAWKECSHTFGGTYKHVIVFQLD